MIEGINWAIKYYEKNKFLTKLSSIAHPENFPRLTSVNGIPRLKATNMYLHPTSGNDYYLVLEGSKNGQIYWR
jgi:hypothetical protein